MQNPLHYALDESAIAHSAQRERLRVFNERSIVGALCSTAGIALLAWVIWTSAGWAAASAWAMSISVVEIAILLTCLRCRHALARDSNPELCLATHIALAGLAGASWGSAAWFVWKDGDTLSYLATMTFLVEVAAVSMVTMASYNKATVLFFSGIYLVPLLHITLHPVPLANFMAVGVLVGLVVQLGYTREMGRVVLQDAEQRARNAALVERLHELVIHDQLTGVYSRRYVFEQMEQLVSTWQRHGTCASIIMFDLDHFKRINDSYGHPTGDRALREVVRAASSQLRDGELLGRIGGEEFLVLLPMTDMAAAQQLAERLRQTLAQTSIVEGTHSIFLPASFGIAELKSAENHSEWLHRVDAALYQAKERGRNTLVAAD
jgi:diguanylate cyclase (GGDEF)-like protein